MEEFSTSRLGCSSCLIKLMIYLALRGLSKEVTLMNCQELKLKVPSNQSGIYRIDPYGGFHDNAFQAYCDWQTDGGVWTSVWSCTFKGFRSIANAISTCSQAGQPVELTRVSTTVPLSETDYETTNFSLWRTIGKEFLIKSNIINWIACKEGTGSLAQMKKGSITCKLVRKVSPNQRSNVVPYYLERYGNRPCLLVSYYYCYFESTNHDWPRHDS